MAGASIKVVRASPKNPYAIGELNIPAIDLRTKVFEGVNETAIKQGPGHWPGTPAPSEPGNFVLSGHRSTETRPFLYLDRLSRGDLITMTQGNTRYRYAVDSVTVVPESRYVPYVLRPPKQPNARMITLFACNPLTASYRRIVFARTRSTGRHRVDRLRIAYEGQDRWQAGRTCPASSPRLTPTLIYFSSP